jgi:hypothetical protein
MHEHKDNSGIFDNSELLRKAALDRQEYFREAEEREKEERAERIADMDWEEQKRRDIIDIEDKIIALEASDRYYQNRISALFRESNDANREEIEILKEKMEQNKFSISDLRVEIDDIKLKKRPR